MFGRFRMLLQCSGMSMKELRANWACHKLHNKCVSKTQMEQTRGVQLKLCATPSRPFQG